MLRGIIETESLQDKLVLSLVDIIDCYKEDHPEDDMAIWTINKVQIESTHYMPFLRWISRSMKHGWYSVFFNDEKVHCVFRNKIIDMCNTDPWRPDDFKRFKEYCQLVQIHDMYCDKLRYNIDNW